MLVFGCSATSGTPEAKPPWAQVVLDQWRADFDGFGEARLELPNVRSLAEEGLRFSRAYEAWPRCGIEYHILA